jgi:hypothetical protein
VYGHSPKTMGPETLAIPAPQSPEWDSWRLHVSAAQRLMNGTAPSLSLPASVSTSPYHGDNQAPPGDLAHSSAEGTSMPGHTSLPSVSAQEGMAATKHLANLKHLLSPDQGQEMEQAPQTLCLSEEQASGMDNFKCDDEQPAGALVSPTYWLCELGQHPSSGASDSSSVKWAGNMREDPDRVLSAEMFWNVPCPGWSAPIHFSCIF